MILEDLTGEMVLILSALAEGGSAYPRIFDCEDIPIVDEDVDY
jgi:hypothetical protein